jgi:hypothetical protein
MGTNILEETEEEGAAGSSETLVPVYQRTGFHIPLDQNFIHLIA